MSSGDLRWTMIVDRCLVLAEDPVDEGEKAATVGSSCFAFSTPSTGGCAGDDAISAIQGVSAQKY